MSGQVLPLVRDACPDDADAIAALSAQLGYPASVEQMRARLQALGADGRHAVRVAEVDDRVTGWAAVELRLTLVGGLRCELVGLVVDEARRGAGIGGRLLAEAEHWARAHGCGEMTVRSNVMRRQAHAFYERHGYTRSKSQHVFKRRWA